MSTPHTIPDLPEQWRPVPGWEDLYEVSTLGRARSLQRTVVNSLGVKTTFKPLIRKTAPNCHGYPFFSVNAKGRPRSNILVHRAALEAFIGPCPSGCECAHWDGDRANGRLSNLRWATHDENYDDRVRHGTDKRGDRCNWAKLDWATVRAIRALPANLTFEQMAAQFGVAAMTAYQIRHWRTWREAESPPPTPTGPSRRRRHSTSSGGSPLT
jgi:hypothetical protein